MLKVFFYKLGAIPTLQGQSGASDLDCKYIFLYTELAIDYSNASFELCSVVVDVFHLSDHKCRYGNVALHHAT